MNQPPTTIIYYRDVTNILFSMLPLLAFIGFATVGIFLLAGASMLIVGVVYAALVIGIFTRLYIRAGSSEKAWKRHQQELANAMRVSGITQSFGDDSGMVARALRLRVPLTSKSTLYHIGEAIYVEGLQTIPTWLGWPLYHETYSIFCYTLPMPVPNTLLIPKKSPQFPDVKQYTELEGSFGDYFSVFAPQQYHRDIRITLTPNVMELLRAFEGCRIEFIDKMMVVYCPLVSPDAITDDARQLAIIQKAVSRNSQRYQDEMGLPGSLSVWSKRLRSKNPFPAGSLIAIAVSAAFVVLGIQESSSTVVLLSALVFAVVIGSGLISVYLWFHEKATRKRIDSLYKNS